MKDPRKITDQQNIRLIDMHTHIRDMCSKDRAMRETAFRKQAGIFSVYCCKTPSEWEFLTSSGCLPVSEGSMLSFGIHPWESDRYDPDDYMELYEIAPIIGEIGLDSVWTDIPQEIQLECFRKQLSIAEKLKKPAVLHTKGCEAETALLTEDFGCPLLIHWYSGDMETLNRFIDRGCFFTLGPDAACGDRERLQTMLSRVRPERLFAETDGIDSIFWAAEEYADLKQLLPDYRQSFMHSEYPPASGQAHDEGNPASGHTCAEEYSASVHEYDDEKDYPLIYESLRRTTKIIADHQGMDIESLVRQQISGLNSFVRPGGIGPVRPDSPERKRHAGL